MWFEQLAVGAFCVAVVAYAETRAPARLDTIGGGEARRSWRSQNARILRARSWIPECLAVAVACVWFVHLGYGPTLDPSHTRWLGRDDWAAYYWGYAFFRNAPASLPLGAVPDLFYPFGSSIAFTDANPWLALALRPLSAVLPTDFQPFGFWYLLCFVVQGIVGVRLARCLLDDPVQVAIGGSLFVLSPLIPARNAHIALCGFFFVSAGVWLHLRRAHAATARRDRLLVLFALVWAAGTHGYLSALLLILSLAYCVKMVAVDGIWSAKEAAANGAAMIASSLATYTLFGYVGWKPADLTAEGFGEFSGDLAALFNPMGWSRLVDALPQQPRQWEGFLYLGIGPLCLVAISTLLVARRPRVAAASLRQLTPLLVAVALMYIYSLSSRVTYHGELVLSLEELYGPFAGITGIFRSSGRFAWPLHFSLLAFGISAAARFRSLLLGRLLLLVGFTLQAYELRTDGIAFDDVAEEPLSDPAWRAAAGTYRHVALVPVQVQWECAFDQLLVNRFSGYAYRARLTLNSGNFMRKEPDTRALCEQHIPRDSALDLRTIYVVRDDFQADFHGRAVCGRLDGVLVCVAPGSNAAFEQALRRRDIV